MASPNTGAIAQSLSSVAAYTTTGKFIESATNTEYYTKAPAWSSGNGYKATIALWLQIPDTGSSLDFIFYDTANRGVTVGLWNWDDTATNNSFRIGYGYLSYLVNTEGSDVHGLKAGDWFALMSSVDYSGSGVPPVVKTWVQKEGATSAIDISTPATTFYNANGPKTIYFDYVTGGNAYKLGANSNTIDFNVSEFFLDGGNTAVDWDSASERAKFVTSEGYPVYLGATGTGLTGSQPRVYAPDADLTNNLGSAGNWTEVGTISDSTSSPSPPPGGAWLNQTGTATFVPPPPVTATVTQTLFAVTSAAGAVLDPDNLGSTSQVLTGISQSITGTSEPPAGVITQIFQREPYLTTGKFIEADWPLYESYERSELWTGGNTNQFTYAAILKVPSYPSNDVVILANGRFYITCDNWWSGGTRQFYIYLTDSGGGEGYGCRTVGHTVHGVDNDEYFALFISVDTSPTGDPERNVWAQKIGETTATNLLTGATEFIDPGPLLEFDFDHNEAGAAVGWHVWYGSTSKDFHLSEIFMTNEYVDWSDPAERAKFVDGSGYPIGLGPTGALLTGTQAKIYAPDGDLTNNLGSGGSWTEKGTIDNSPDSPSDGTDLTRSWLSQAATGMSWEFTVTSALTLPSVFQSGHVALIGTWFAQPLAQTLFPVTSAGTATYVPGTDTGAISSILPAVTSYGDIRYFAGTKLSSSAQYLWPVTSVGTATYKPGTDTGAIAAVLPAITSAATGTRTKAHFGVATQILPVISSAGTATFVPGIDTGAISQQLPFITSAITATYKPGTKTGIIWQQALPSVYQSLTGEVWETAIGIQILPSVTSTGTATFAPGTDTGVISQTLSAVSASLTAKKVKSATITQNLSAVVTGIASGAYEPGDSIGIIRSFLPLTTQVVTGTFEPGPSEGFITLTLYAVQQSMLGVSYKAIASPQLLYEQQTDELIYEVPDEPEILVCKEKVL